MSNISRQWGVFETDFMHLIPIDDIREHETVAQECWCKPEFEEPGIVIHFSADQREKYEGMQ